MEKNSAVTPVMSEMLLITLVLILIPVVTISLMYQLPEGRVPTITITMEVDAGSGVLHSVTFYHKGGDYIKKEDLSVIVRTKFNGVVKEYGPYSGSTLVCTPGYNQVFDLGDSVTTPGTGIPLEKGTVISISLLGKKSVVYTGEFTYEG